jgi:hypothetical protein
MINIYQILQQAVGSECIALVGSRALGTSASIYADFDIMIYEPAYKNFDEIFDKYRERFFPLPLMECEPPYSANGIRLNIGHSIDIIIVADKDLFDRRVDQHKRIIGLLQSSPLPGFVQAMRAEGVAGQVIYRALCKHLLNEESI